MEASVGIMDNQSVKWNNAALNSVDGNKKIKGIKQHIKNWLSHSRYGQTCMIAKPLIY